MGQLKYNYLKNSISQSVIKQKRLNNFFKIFKTSMPPNWDDEFDFDDLDAPKKNTKKPPKIKKTTDEDDFFDLDEPLNSKPTKTKKQPQTKSLLPNIATRNQSAKRLPNTNQSQKKNPYADKSFGNGNLQHDDYDFEQEQIQEQSVSKSRQSLLNVGGKFNKKANDSQVNQVKNNSKVHEELEEDYYDELEEPIQQEVSGTGKSKSNLMGMGNNYEEDIMGANKNKENKGSNQNITKEDSKEQEEEEDNYEEEFENQGYADEEFEEEPAQITEPIKPKLKLDDLPQKPSQTKTNNLTAKSTASNPKKQLSKPPINVNRKNAKMSNVTSNKQINKIQSHSVQKPLINRHNSRKSIRSNDSKRLVSKSRITQQNNQSQYFPNKHQDIVEKSFPHEQEQLNKLTQNDINRINEKMRNMIRKFNDELNDLINKNMLLLKSKTNEKQVTVEDRVRELEMQRKTGQTAIDVMEKEFQKLQGREGELKEEEYQLHLERKIQDKKLKIKQTAKDITVIKRQVDNKGKKLSVKQQEKRDAQTIHHLKTILIQTKKDEQKGQQKIQKLTLNQEQLQTKLSDVDYKLEDLISQARQKGVNIQNQQVLTKKYQQLKKKLQMTKNFNKKSQNLLNTKVDILNHENEQLRITIRNINSQINNLYGSIDHSQNQSIKLISKAKEKTNITPIFAQSLEQLLKQLQEAKISQIDYQYARSEVRSRRSTSSVKNVKPGKVSKTQNLQNSIPLRNAQSQNKILHEEETNTNLVKPKFLKKKPQESTKMETQSKSQVNERYWSEEQGDNNLKIGKSGSISLNQQTPSNQKSQQKKQKSKPFMLKKNKTQQKSQQPSIDQTRPKQSEINEVILPEQVKKTTKEQQKKQETQNINIAPRMMRFGRKKKQQQESKKQIQINNTKEESNYGIKENLNLNTPQEEKNHVIDEPKKQDKPIFAPKRFNLRNRNANKQQDSYTPSIQDNSRQQQPKTLENIKTPQNQTKETREQQSYKPKFDFKSQLNDFKIQEKKPQEQQKVNNGNTPFGNNNNLLSQEPTQEIKPKFNLRLRDRMKKNNQDNNDGYMPSSNKNISVKNDQNKYEPTGSYAPKKFSTEEEKSTNNPYSQPKQNILNNPYAAKQQNVTSNPYAPTNSDPPKRQRGPLKKNKISINNLPKQKVNIYDQAQDLTKNDVNQFNPVKQSPKKNLYEPQIVQAQKTQQLDLNAMLGIKKQTKKNDFDDLLGDMGSLGKKGKKKNNDFFGDLQI